MFEFLDNNSRLLGRIALIGSVIGAVYMFLKFGRDIKSYFVSLYKRFRPLSEAQKAYRNYETALKAAEWGVALSALRSAVYSDRKKYEPFPFNRYDPKRILGSGGFGVVFLVQDLQMKSDCVIKSLLTSKLDPSLKDPLDEARALAQIKDPSIIQVMNCDYAGPDRKRPYIVMEHFDARNLQNWVAGGDGVDAEGIISPQDMLEIATKLATGLKAAHDKGILHRDVKPENILIKRQAPAYEGATATWQVKLLDFGLAVRPESLKNIGSTEGPAARTTMEKTLAGTVDYAAPEQMGKLDAKVDRYSDVYAFGKTCYFALREDPDPGEFGLRELPGAWREVLGKCTAKPIQKRYHDFGEVLKALRNLAAAKSVEVSIQPKEPDVVKKIPVASTLGLVPAGALALKLQAKGIEVKGYQAEDRFIVLAPWQAVKAAVPSLSNSYAKKRSALKQEGVLTEGTDFLVAKMDYAFESASMAATVILGRNANGRIEWKDADGRTLKEIQDAPDPDAATTAAGSPVQEHPEQVGPYKKFWEGLVSRRTAKDTRHSKLSRPDSNWFTARTGVAGLSLGYGISQDEGAVHLYIDRGPEQKEVNKRIFDELHSQKKEIEKVFGGELSWQRLNDRRACRIASTITVGGYKSDESQLPEIQDAMIDAMMRLEKAITPYLEKLKTELALV